MTRFDHAVSRLGSILSGRRPLAKAPIVIDDLLREFGRTDRAKAVFAQAQRLGHTTKLLPPPSPNRAEYPFVASMVYQGIPIDIEQRKGDTREGVDADGTPWKVTMQAHYGEVRSHARGASGVMGARGMDGDRLDVYIGDDPRSELVVVVDQRIPETGEHDEQKVMLGFSTVDEALACYRKQYTKPGFYGGHTTMGIDDFRAKIADPANAGKVLKKAPAPVGTVHTWADGRRHRKTPDGWVEVRTVSPAKPVRTGAVPVSDALVDNIADEVIDIVRRGGDGDDRVATVRPREFATHVRTADGELVHVTVRVALNALSRRGVTGRMSFYAERKDDGQRTQSRRGLIQISVGEEGLFGSSARDLRERIKSTLSHELTHAADPAVRLNFESQASRGAKIVGSRDVLRDEGREAYINDEGEVTARIQQIIRELRQSKNVDRIKADMADHASDPDAMPRPGVVAWEIQESPTWMKIESQLNEDNRRRVLRAVARVVRGIMDGSVTPLAKALAALPPGSLLLPEAHGRRAFFSQLMKGKAHRYIKRVPIPGKFTKKGTPRYRYFYHVARGAGGVHAQEHFVEGAGFMAHGGHWHIKAVDGDRLTIEHDENGQSRTVTKAELAAMLHAEHKAGIEKYEADKKERAQKRLEADRKEAAVYGTDAQRKRLGLPTKAEEEAAKAPRASAQRPPRRPGDQVSIRARGIGGMPGFIEGVVEPGGLVYVTTPSAREYRRHVRLTDAWKTAEEHEADGRAQRAAEEADENRRRGDALARRESRDEGRRARIAAGEIAGTIPNIIPGAVLSYGPEGTSDTFTVRSVSKPDARGGVDITKTDGARTYMLPQHAADWTIRMPALPPKKEAPVITKAEPSQAPAPAPKQGRDPTHTAKLDDKIARLEREVARLGGETSHNKAMAEAFPLGAGSMRPTGQRGGSNRRAEQHMDASIDRAKRHIEATRELNSLKARRAAYVEGRVNEQGRSIEPEPVKPKSKAPRRTITDDQKRRGITKERAKLEAAAWAATHKDFKGFMPDGTPDIMRGGVVRPLGDFTDDELRKIAPKRMEKALRRLATLLR